MRAETVGGLHFSPQGLPEKEEVVAVWCVRDKDLFIYNHKHRLFDHNSSQLHPHVPIV